MKIVICDDCREDLLCMELMLHKYRKSNINIQFDVELYSNSASLYSKINNRELADIYILDMIMPDKTGIDIGNLIRRINKECVIIYVTSSDDFAIDAYEVYAIRYLLKPIHEDLFFEALDYAFSSSKTDNDIFYPIKTKTGIVEIPYSKIEYIENYSRILNVCLTNKEIIKSIFIRKSFDDEINTIAEDKRFLQVHKSFLINMNHVKKMEQDCIVMGCGKKIPISRARAADVRRQYLLFIAENCKGAETFP